MTAHKIDIGGQLTIERQFHLGIGKSSIVECFTLQTILHTIGHFIIGNPSSYTPREHLIAVTEVNTLIKTEGMGMIDTGQVLQLIYVFIEDILERTYTILVKLLVGKGSGIVIGIVAVIA